MCKIPSRVLWGTLWQVIDQLRKPQMLTDFRALIQQEFYWAVFSHVRSGRKGSLIVLLACGRREMGSVGKFECWLVLVWCEAGFFVAEGCSRVLLVPLCQGIHRAAP